MTGEVDGVAWQPLPLTDLLTGLAPGARHVVAVDGHGASGKSTLAHRLSAVAGRPAAVVHTDDVAWHHSFFDWADLLAGGVLDPFRAGEPVRFRPPAWERRGRAGAIVVPDGTELLLVEGTGVGRRSLAAAVDLLLWVHVDPAVARERGLARDLAAGENGGTPESVARFWDEWMAEEDPFLERERPWERAAWLVHGHPPTPLPPDQVLAAGRFRSNPDLVEDPEQPELRRGSGTAPTSSRIQSPAASDLRHPRRSSHERRPDGPPRRRRQTMPQYALMVWGPVDSDEHDGYATAEENAAQREATGAFNERLESTGRFVYANGMADASASAVVDSRGETPLVTDGPYLETREHIAGFWIITAADRDEALALATEGSRACMRPVEVRPMHGG